MFPPWLSRPKAAGNPPPMENETLAKNRHIDSLTLDAQLKEISLKRNKLIQNTAIFGALMLLIMTGLIYSRYRLK